MRNTLLTACFILITTSSALSFGCGMQNLDTVKAQLIRYHDSGRYEKDQAAVVAQAKQYLQTRIANKKPSDKLAIVFDIDETTLSNYNDMLHLNFGGTYDDIVNAEDKGTDPAIKPTLELYHYAKAHHVAIFFVTGRSEKYRSSTMRNLENVGYTDWNDLILKPENYHDRSAAPFKIAARKSITQQGYDIVLSMGDQQSDLTGGYADKTFKLPNPYYFLP